MINTMSNSLKIDDSWLFDPQRLVEPSSWAGHTPFAAWLIANIQPRRLVELGTHTGFSYGSFCQTVQSRGLATECYAVDTWQGDEHAGLYSDAIFEEVRAWHDAHYAGFSRLLRMTFDEALGYFSDGSVDLLHIDGLHTYDAVKHDFDTWLPKLSSRGVVLLHDTNVRERGFGVWQLWETLSARYPHIGFDHSSGLGVLLVGDDVAPELVNLTRSYAQHPALIRGIFAQLGGRIENFCDLRHERSQNQARGQALEEREAMLQLRDAAIAEKDTALREQQEVQRQLHEQIERLMASRSWRLTTPLRALMGLLRR
uniref:class I SAM-dependent methyltransferase n=1 Tax=uncultured Halomonas sp. TaxID=173971 RepID=UPI0026024DE1|nr:class I SAM-dependent methyltransferase [uncultured Halomonas sp.]